MNKDQDYKTATLAIKKPLDDLDKLQADHDVVFRENQDVKRRCVLSTQAFISVNIPTNRAAYMAISFTPFILHPNK